MTRFPKLGLLVLGSLLAATPAKAVIWAEFGDAGALPGTAQTAAGSGTLTNITGALQGGSDCCNENDVDLYRIYISNPAAFSARTLLTVGAGTFDTQLFLFSAAGRGVEGNDDIVAGSMRNSFLTAGNAFAPTVAGLYYLAITAWDNEPRAGGLAIFGTAADGIVGPTGPGGLSALSGWSNGGADFDEGFAYNIQLTGAEAIPEPGTLLLLGSGLTGLALRRRRRNDS